MIKATTRNETDHGIGRRKPGDTYRLERMILHLKGGRSRLCSPSDGTVLGELVAWVRNPLPAQAKLFRVSTPEGRALNVPAADIVGLELAPPFCLIRNFLPAPEMERIRAHALAHEHAFGDATVSLPAYQGTSIPNYHFRRSRTLSDVADLMPMLAPRLTALMPQLWRHLRMDPIPLGRIECQLASHGDGGFFKTHTDNGSPDVAHRRVSYVYYFHREPRQFGGGHLCLYGTILKNGLSTCGQRWFDIEPPRNSLIVFPSDIHHEVTRVTCSSNELADQRLTLNSWLCR